MSTMKLIHAGTFIYKGLGGCRSFCRLTLYANNETEEAIAHWVELEANTGTSVTNVAEILAEAIVRAFLWDAFREKLTIIESYEETAAERENRRFDSAPETEYSLVKFAAVRPFADASWEPLPTEQFRAMMEGIDSHV